MGQQIRREIIAYKINVHLGKRTLDAFSLNRSPLPEKKNFSLWQTASDLT